MTTTYHTAITMGAAANAATFNTPLAALDAQLVANQAAIDALTLATGNAATLANGAANAGQKIIVVDSTSGFLAGAPIAYTLVGGVIEFNTVGTVDSPTQLTATVNIGTGGIANNTYIAVVPPGAMASSGVVVGATSTKQTLTNGAFLGGLTSSGDDAALLIGRAATNPLSGGGSHAVRDESTYAASGSGGYASYDAIPIVSSASAVDHIRAFQARPEFSGSAGLSQLAGFHSQPTVTGNMTNAYGLFVDDALGAGTITLQFGVYVDTLTRGAGNYGIYVNGNDSYFGGKVQVTGAVEATGALSGSNFYTRNAENTVGVGIGIPAGGASYYGTFIGHDAGHSVTATNGQTYVGSRAGYTNTTAGGVYIGNGAGYYETAANKLFIDNATRTSEAEGRTNALIYGIFNAAVASQELTFNAGKMGFFGHAAAAQPTKAGNNNWAAFSDVVNALVAIGIFDTA